MRPRQEEQLAKYKMEARAAALVANLTMAEKLNTFMLVGQLHGVPRLNVKSFRWDATDIEGVDDQVFKFNNTCFPHAIGIGATFDRDMMRSMASVVGREQRAGYTLGNFTDNGRNGLGLECWGPVINMNRDPVRASQSIADAVRV